MWGVDAENLWAAHRGLIAIASGVVIMLAMFGIESWRGRRSAWRFAVSPVPPSPTQIPVARSTSPTAEHINPLAIKARDDGFGSGPWGCVATIREVTFSPFAPNPKNYISATAVIMFYCTVKTPIPLTLSLNADGGSKLCQLSAELDSIYETHLEPSRWRVVRYAGIIPIDTDALASPIRSAGLLKTWIMANNKALADDGISFGPDGGAWNTSLESVSVEPKSLQ